MIKIAKRLSKIKHPFMFEDTVTDLRDLTTTHNNNPGVNKLLVWLFSHNPGERCIPIVKDDFNINLSPYKSEIFAVAIYGSTFTRKSLYERIRMKVIEELEARAEPTILNYIRRLIY